MNRAASFARKSAPRAGAARQLDRAGIIRSDQRSRTAYVSERALTFTPAATAADLSISGIAHINAVTPPASIWFGSAPRQQLVHGHRVAQLNSQHQDRHGGFAFDRRKG